MSLIDKLLGVHPAMQQDKPVFSQEDLAWNSLGQNHAQRYQDLQNAYVAGVSGTAFTVSVNPDSQPLHRMTMDDLKGEAATASLENLSNLWQARWRSQWVRRSEIDGEFYNIAATRLNAAHMLEAHQLADGTQVYRLIERP